MGRVGKVNRKREREWIRTKSKGSDESDEDYTVGEDNQDESEDYHSSDGDVLEEAFDSFGEEEVVGKFVRPKTQKGSSGRRKGGGKKSNKKRALYEDGDEEYEEDDDEEYEEDDEQEEEEEGDYFDDEDSEDYYEVEESTSIDACDKRKTRVKKARKRKRKSYKEDEEEDYDFDVDDEEFTPNEIDCLDEEEELPKKKRVRSKPSSRKKRSAGEQKRKKKSKVPKKPLRKKQKKNRGPRRNGISRKYGEVVEQKNGRRRLKRSKVQSDSDFMSLGPSDFEFTLSEEEREQVREASEFCGSLTSSLRGSKMPKRLEGNGSLNKERKNQGGKGKEKVEEFKDVILGKQVCGICFSEEGKKVVQGILNCCSHYYCFSCIMEWSKVESRCPLCKQRFKTITKPTRPDSKDVVIQVPKRDQVYQPSEEEVRGYLDPYENVICTECQQGGDDGLMLLCDLCDSPAHTYCVGLGREVPEGNWYCEGCRPSLGSADSQAQTQAQTHSLLDQTPTRNNSSNGLPLDLDLNSAYVPDTPLSNGTPSILSPRYHFRDFEATSPVSTVSGRRRIHRHIQNFLSSSRMSQTGGRPNRVSTSSPRSDFLDPLEGRVREDNPSTSVPYRDFFSRLSHLRRHVVQDPTTTRTDGLDRGSLRDGLLETNSGGNAVSGYESIHQSRRRLSIGSDVSGSPGGFLNVEKEQLQSMVRRHLKSLSSGVDLGISMFKDIARSSTHTILAACGLEHRRSEVIPVQPPPPMYRCLHPETVGSMQMSLIKGLCSSCFDSFVKDVVKRIMSMKLPQRQFSFHN